MYIAIHAEAERRPKAIRAAAAYNLQPRQFIFTIMGPVWMFAAETFDGSGEITGLDDEILAVITFGAAKTLQPLLDHKWLIREGERLLVKDWIDHEPYFAELSYDRLRKRAERQRKREDVLRKSTGHPTEIRTKEVEERRGDKRTTISNAAALDPKTSKTKQRPPHWSEPHGSQLKSLEGCPAGGPWSFLNRLARKHTEQAVLSALGKLVAKNGEIANWKHAAGWLTTVAAEEGQAGPEPQW